MKNCIFRTQVLMMVFFATLFAAQTGSLNINIYDDFSKKPLPATITVVSTGNSFSGEGNVVLNNLPAGNYSFQILSEGYESGLLNDISVVPNQNLTYSLGLTKSKTREKEIEGVIVKRKVYKTTAESPVSLRNITSEEVQKNAGSNRDISKAILSLPGVGTTATFRNDLFIRGGSSAENKFLSTVSKFRSSTISKPKVQVAVRKGF